MSTILGVDPGLSGALAFCADGVMVYQCPMPVKTIMRGGRARKEVDADGLMRIIQEYRPERAFIERVGGMTGQSASASFVFGRAVGVVEGVIATLGVAITAIPPIVWKKHFGLVLCGKSDSVKKAEALFNVKLRLTQHGIAEAMLIARYGCDGKRLASLT